MAAGLAAVLMAACTAVPPEPAGEVAGSPAELAAALNVGVEGDSVRLELHVTNATGEALLVEFTSAQRYDFTVVDDGGSVVWRWSDEMMFAQVMGTESLQPGETRRYAASWYAGALRGEYVATGRLVSTNYPVELRTSIRLPVE
jgi:hypothetical protein